MEWRAFKVGLPQFELCLEVLVFLDGNLDDTLYTILVSMILVLTNIVYGFGSSFRYGFLFGLVLSLWMMALKYLWRNLKRCNQDTVETHCNILNWMGRWNMWKDEFSSYIHKDNDMWAKCAIDSTKLYTLKIIEWKMEVDAFMTIHQSKHEEHSF